MQFLGPTAAMQNSDGASKGGTKEVSAEEYKQYLKTLKKKEKKQKKQAKKVPPRNFAAEKVREAATARDRGGHYESPFGYVSYGGSGPGL